MALDESFKKPGAIPFKWEVRPGVPKVQTRQPEQQPKQQKLQKQKLAPPPAGYHFQVPQVEPRTRSFISAPRTRSERYRFYSSSLARPESVLTSSGCFPTTPVISRKNGKKKIGKHKLELEVGPESVVSEPDCGSDLEAAPRLSVSTRRSVSPFWNSPLSSSFSSRRSSPRPLNNAQWAGFGLF